MVSSSWFLIRRIGPMMGINLILVAPLSTSPSHRIRIDESPIAGDRESKRSEDPLLGVFEVSENGKSLLFCNEKNLDQIDNAIYMTLEGDHGRVAQIKSVQKEYINKINKYNATEKYVENINNNEQIYYFSGQIDSIKLKQNAYSLGFLLRPGSAIGKKINPNKYLIKFKGERFNIESVRTKEGIHYKSLALPSRSEKSHYYFYLGYETE